ncbi:hypothetical protein F503_02407 [Ophiostoma piceae UAMH 11346]|uniref:Uncharacterized protein n=1 Tax=Ophiostoma piceae (strain UAMH 11346) TaxID=1262450 RepID=S3BYG8_OPHP1|nr:hypothetical protein F503_02407 [Ophiostoma piceae UAMH 11346]
MAWDSKATVASRRRGNSIHNRSSSLSSNLTLQQKAGAPSPSVVQPKSAHVSDPFLQDFLQPGFDPAAYWNRTLANVSSSSSSSSSNANAASPSLGSTGRSGSGAASRLAAAATSATATADRAAQAQATLSQLGAHTSRLTTVLTQLTDDILRSGSRLAYEVELLRGETISLAELVQQQAAAFPDASAAGPAGEGEKGGGEEVDGGEKDKQDKKEVDQSEPASLAQLRMLAQVRASLDAVIRTFGDAMEFVMPPSAMSVTASFLSVSGPDQDSRRRSSSNDADAGENSNINSMEDKGQQVLKTKRDEIARLLDAATIEQDDANMKAAVERIGALQTLCQVWTGTAEEKARFKFVDSLQRLVDDRQREIDRERERIEQQKQQQEKREKEAAKTATGPDTSNPSSSQGSGTPAAPSSAQSSQGTQDAGGARGYAAAGYGFISQLQKIRSGL